MYTLQPTDCGVSADSLQSKGRKNAQPQKQELSFFQDTPFSNPSHTALIEQGMASNVRWFFPSDGTRDLSHSGLGYHVSGTSKSLAELSETLPAGERSFFIFLNFLVFFLPSVGGSAQESVCSNSRSEVSLASEPASA